MSYDARWKSAIADLLKFVKEGPDLCDKVAIKKRSESKLLKLLEWWIKPMNPGFKRFGITLGNTIYLPDSKWEPNGELRGDSSTFEMVAHELQHVFDRTTIAWAYLLPHSLALPLAIIAGFLPSPWLWLCLGLACVLLTPLPNYLGLAYMRAKLEARAYAVSAAVLEWNEMGPGPKCAESFFNWVSVSVMGGPQYYWPMPNRVRAKKLLAQAYAELNLPVGHETTLYGEYGQVIRAILARHNLRHE